MVLVIVLAVIAVVVYGTILYLVASVAEGYGRHALPWVLLAVFLGLFTFIPLWACGPTEEERLRRVRADEEERLRVDRELRVEEQFAERPRYPPAPGE